MRDVYINSFLLHDCEHPIDFPIKVQLVGLGQFPAYVNERTRATDIEFALDATRIEQGAAEWAASRGRMGVEEPPHVSNVWDSVFIEEPDTK
jgi:hypothetical protein